MTILQANDLTVILEQALGYSSAKVTLVRGGIGRLKRITSASPNFHLPLHDGMDQLTITSIVRN
jgi:hypothetical protein